MELRIDGKTIESQPGQTLLELVVALGMDSDKLSQRPLAAKIAGEVFNLNYVPVRSSDVCQDRPSIRKAMEASGGIVHLLHYTNLHVTFYLFP